MHQALLEYSVQTDSSHISGETLCMALPKPHTKRGHLRGARGLKIHFGACSLVHQRAILWRDFSVTWHSDRPPVVLWVWRLFLISPPPPPALPLSTLNPSALAPCLKWHAPFYAAAACHLPVHGCPWVLSNLTAFLLLSPTIASYPLEIKCGTQIRNPSERCSLSIPIPIPIPRGW